MASQSKTYSAAQVVDADGVKTSIATSTSAALYTSADWNGAVLNASEILDLPRTITITLSNNAAQFSVSPIVLTGIRGGRTVTESLTPVLNGNVTLRGTQIFDRLVSVALPAMAGTGGTITIGVQDICAPFGTKFESVELAAAGTLNLGYGPDHAVASSDAIPITAVSTETPRLVDARRILTSSALSAPTTVGLTVYIE